MSELVKKRLKESISKNIIIYLNNGFRYAGKVTGCDDEYIELLDFKTDCYKVISLTEIKDFEVDQ